MIVFNDIIVVDSAAVDGVYVVYKAPGVVDITIVVDDAGVDDGARVIAVLI